MTTTTPKADRFHRAPRGGIVSPVNGIFYKGGQFLPKSSAPIEVKPAPLVGSSRQVAWANRIRREALARIEEDIMVRRMFLNDAKIVDEPGVRRAIRRDSIALHRLMVERSAGSIIEMRASFA